MIVPYSSTMSDNTRTVSKFFRPKKTSPVINDDRKSDDEGLGTTAVDGGDDNSSKRKAVTVTESVGFFGGGAVEEDSKTNLDDIASEKIPSNDDIIKNKATNSDTVTVDLTRNHGEESTTSAPLETTATNRNDPVSLRDRESIDGQLSSSSPTPPPPPIPSSLEQVETQKRRRNPFEMFAHAESRTTSTPMSSSFLRQ